MVGLHVKIFSREMTAARPEMAGAEIFSREMTAARPEMAGAG